MNKRANNFFWIVYIVFCICSATVLMFFGSPIDPEMGMVNAVLPADQLLDHAVAYAADLAANVSPTSMAVMKQQVYADYSLALGEAEQRALGLMKESLRRPDFKEGVASFLEKRPPNFSPVTR